MFEKINKAEKNIIKARMALHTSIMHTFKPGSIHKCYRHSTKGYDVEICEQDFEQWRTDSYVLIKNIKTGNIKRVWWQELIHPRKMRQLWTKP